MDQHDPLRDRLDRAIDGQALTTLTVVADLLGIDREAARKRHQRGTLGVRTIKTGRTSPVLVPSADVYRLLGFEAPETVSAPRTVLVEAEVMPDGTLRLPAVA